MTRPPAGDDVPLAALGPLGRVRLALEVVAAYPHVRRALRRQDVRDTIAALRGSVPAQREPPSPRSLAEGLRLGRAVARTLRLLPADSRCLTQSLVLTRLLARRSIGGVLVIAVRPGAGFGAHAWVELGGAPLLPTGSDEFERLVEL